MLVAPSKKPKLLFFALIPSIFNTFINHNSQEN
jgi:hypothetical protein